jgi:CRISPR-associated helicase Cas3
LEQENNKMVTLEVAEGVETSLQFFQQEFKALRGYKPYPYQEQQFSSVLNGRPAELVYIPTGGGKTEIIAVWLLAVLYQIKTTRAVSIPRRLYYAVDRRSVVDQTELVAADLLVATVRVVAGFVLRHASGVAQGFRLGALDQLNTFEVSTTVGH